MPQPINFSTATAQLRPLVDYLKRQKDNQSFYRSVELNATIFLIIFFVFFAIKPTVTTISSLIGDIKAKEIQQNQLKTKINQIIKAQDLYSQVQEKYSLISQCLPDSPSYYQAANQIYGASSVPVNDLDFVFPQSENPITASLKSYSIPITLPAPFTETTTVLNNLLQNRRLLQIQSISFSLPKATDLTSDKTSVVAAPGSVTADFDATIYYWDPSNEKNQNQ